MSLATIFVLILVTVGAFWLWKIVHKHVGQMPDAPPIAIWGLQMVTILVLVVAVCGVWGYGGGFITSGDIHIR